MGIGDWGILAVLAVWLAAALAGMRRKKGCGGDCGRCGKCR
ncbi:MAG: FeoB-associated Cys-rich membrane protein [Oscillospiraceae bacterium]|nr:FeoB-associated Cys-rich membrane protein [Oscillospiraceae bacterium]